jgi:hypothetical protein
VESALSVRAPAPRTVPPANVPHRNARGEQRDQGRARASVHPSASVAGNDAPLIDERAATRGRVATGVAMSRR